MGDNEIWGWGRNDVCINGNNIYGFNDAIIGYDMETSNKCGIRVPTEPSPEPFELNSKRHIINLFN